MHPKRKHWMVNREKWVWSRILLFGWNRVIILSVLVESRIFPVLSIYLFHNGHAVCWYNKITTYTYKGKLYVLLVRWNTKDINLCYVSSSKTSNFKLYLDFLVSVNNMVIDWYFTSSCNIILIKLLTNYSEYTIEFTILITPI